MSFDPYRAEREEAYAEGFDHGLASANELIAAAHKLLDAAGVPSADHVRCDERDCNSKLEHRIRWLIRCRTTADPHADFLRAAYDMSDERTRAFIRAITGCDKP